MMATRRSPSIHGGFGRRKLGVTCPFPVACPIACPVACPVAYPGPLRVPGAKRSQRGGIGPKAPPRLRSCPRVDCGGTSRAEIAAFF